MNRFSALTRLGLALALALAAALSGCGADSAEQLVASGKAEIAKNNRGAAVIRFKAALQLEPQLTEARYLLGSALLEVGDAPGAVRELSKAMDQRWPADQVLPPLAQALLTIGNHQRLTSEFGDTTLDNPQATAALKSAVATAWSALGDPTKAQEATLAALAAAPDNQAALLLKARLAAGRGDFAEALAQAHAIVSADPKRHDAWLLQGEVQALQGDGAGAESSLRKAIELQPAHAPAHQALVNLLLQRPDMAAAKTALEAMRSALPNHPTTVFADAQVALAEGELNRARDLAQQLVRMAPDNVSVLMLSGAVEARVGSQALAETQLAKALRIDPERKQGRVLLAQVYLRLGQTGKALETLRPLLSGAGADAVAHALAGDAQLRVGDARAAEAHFRKAAELDPSDDRHAVAVALAQMAEGESVAAFKALKSIAERSKSIHADMAIVSARMRRGEFDAALAAVDAMSRKQPNSAGLLVLKGRVQMAGKNLPAARNSFEQALRLDPALFEATSNLAGIEWLQGDTESAKQRLQAAIQSDPQNHLARAALAGLQERLGEPADEVLQTLRLAVQASPGATGPRVQLIDVLLRNHRTKDAFAAARDAAAAFPTDPQMLAAVGRAQEKANAFEQALNTYRRLSNLLPASGEPWVRVADMYRASGRPDAAEASLRKALETEPELEEAQRSLVGLLLQQKRGDEALRLAQDGQRLRPQSASGYLFEGLARLRLGSAAEAIAVFKKGLATVPDSSPLARALYSALAGKDNAGSAEAERHAAQWLKSHPDDVEFDYHVGMAESARRSWAAAEARLQRVAQRRPNSPVVLNNLAWVLAKQGKPGAVGYAQRAVDASPQEAPLLDTLAVALAAEKQYDKALVIQRQAIALAASDPNLKLGLARIALQAGDRELAKQELEALQALGATFDQQPEVDRLLATI